MNLSSGEAADSIYLCRYAADNCLMLIRGKVYNKLGDAIALEALALENTNPDAPGYMLLRFVDHGVPHLDISSSVGNAIQEVHWMKVNGLVTWPTDPSPLVCWKIELYQGLFHQPEIINHFAQKSQRSKYNIPLRLIRFFSSTFGVIEPSFAVDVAALLV